MTDHGPLYKYAINEDIIFEITLAESNRILVATDTKDWGYKLSNICLEYDTVTSENIANTMMQKYNSGFCVLHDFVDYVRTVSIKANDTLINENINIPRRSIKGVFLLFLKSFTDGQRKSEEFHNPEIKDIEITIEGISNKLFNTNMRMLDQFNEAKKFFMPDKITEDSNMNIEKFYGGKYFGLWIDFRTTPDNSIHGNGTRLQNSKDGIQLSFKKTSEVAYQMNVFLVSDAQINIMNKQVQSIQY